MFPSILVAAALVLFPTDDPPAAAAATPSAADILDRAIEVQHGEKIGNTIKDFEVKLRLKRNDEQAKVELDVVRRFKAPDRIWTQVHEAITATTYVEGTVTTETTVNNTSYSGPNFNETTTTNISMEDGNGRAIG